MYIFNQKKKEDIYKKKYHLLFIFFKLIDKIECYHLKKKKKLTKISEILE